MTSHRANRARRDHIDARRPGPWLDDAAEHSSQPTLVYVIGRVGQGLRRELQEVLGEWDLSVPEYTALAILEARPMLSNAQLARRSLITPQSMNLVVAELERRKLVQRSVDSEHNRILRAEVTGSGRVLLAAVGPAVARLEDAMMAGVSPRSREVVLDALVECMHVLARSREERERATRPAAANES